MCTIIIVIIGIWDPIAVEFCHQAGAGTSLPLRFGGKTSVTSGLPIDAVVDIITVQSDATQPFVSSVLLLASAAPLLCPCCALLHTLHASRLTPCAFHCTYAHAQGDANVELGDTALISIPVEGGTIEVVLWTARTQTFHPAAFESVGCGAKNAPFEPFVCMLTKRSFY